MPLPVLGATLNCIASRTVLYFYAYWFSHRSKLTNFHHFYAARLGVVAFCGANLACAACPTCTCQIGSFRASVYQHFRPSSPGGRKCSLPHLEGGARARGWAFGKGGRLAWRTVPIKCHLRRPPLPPTKPWRPCGERITAVGKAMNGCGQVSQGRTMGADSRGKPGPRHALFASFRRARRKLRAFAAVPMLPVRLWRPGSGRWDVSPEPGRRFRGRPSPVPAPNRFGGHVPGGSPPLLASLYLPIYRQTCFSGDFS